MYTNKYLLFACFQVAAPVFSQYLLPVDAPRLSVDCAAQFLSLKETNRGRSLGEAVCGTEMKQVIGSVQSRKIWFRSWYCLRLEEQPRTARPLPEISYRIPVTNWLSFTAVNSVKQLTGPCDNSKKMTPDFDFKSMKTRGLPGWRCDSVT